MDRDIKPANVILDAGLTCVVDFDGRVPARTQDFAPSEGLDLAHGESQRIRRCSGVPKLDSGVRDQASRVAPSGFGLAPEESSLREVDPKTAVIP